MTFPVRSPRSLRTPYRCLGLASILNRYISCRSRHTLGTERNFFGPNLIDPVWGKMLGILEQLCNWPVQRHARSLASRSHLRVQPSRRRFNEFLI
ncbi:hypothetical protein X801_06380 [Opisthorchis viverrini]|uniref:Uncharacterized protein n=1 Tax=Opisthorchis viverrini TaxID=6198 RepID=A0A1S8WTL2_OPIVI|nr:hypothetical protein X801_06380 [Opisthorchis viverrini]